MSQNSKLSVHSTRSEREQIAKNLFLELKQEQDKSDSELLAQLKLERDRRMEKVVSKLTDFIVEGSNRGSSHGVSNLSDFDDESLASVNTSEFNVIKRSQSESMLGKSSQKQTDHSPFFSPLPRVMQVDGNDTVESQPDGILGEKTPVLPNKGQFSAPGSSLRREKEKGSFSENGNEELTPRDKSETPESLKNLADVSFKSMIGNITRKFGGFRLSPNKNQQTLQHPEKATEKTLQNEDLQDKQVAQVIPVDYSGIKIPQTAENDQNKVAEGKGYTETPFRNSSDIHTGKTDPKFKHRLPLTNYEGRDDDYSGAFCANPAGYNNPVGRSFLPQDGEKTNLLRNDSWTEENTSKESFRKASNAVTQYKGVISKRCNKIRSELKTLTTSELESSLTDLNEALKIFEQKCQSFLAHEMTEENRTLQLHSFNKYEGDLFTTKRFVSSELESRWQALRSENTSSRQVGAEIQTPKKTGSELEREVLASVERTHSKPHPHPSDKTKSNNPEKTKSGRKSDTLKNVNWATVARQQGNKIRETVHKQAQRRRDGYESDTSDISIALRALYDIA